MLRGEVMKSKPRHMLTRPGRLRARSGPAPQARAPTRALDLSFATFFRDVFLEIFFWRFISRFRLPFWLHVSCFFSLVWHFVIVVLMDIQSDSSLFFGRLNLQNPWLPNRKTIIFTKSRFRKTSKWKSINSMIHLWTVFP